MSERERAINRDLRVLDEAHRLGRITRAEYRARRRRVLGAMRDSGNLVTARKDLLSQEATTSPRLRHAQAPAAGGDSAANAMTSLLMRPPVAWKPWLGVLAGVVVLVVLACWLVFRD